MAKDWLFEFADKLHGQMTPTERVMWSFLQRLGFRSQAVVDGRWVADFVHEGRGVVVEVDGGIHLTRDQIVKDRAKDAWLWSNGYRVLRFWNDEVERKWPSVESVIRKAVATSPRATPTPLPKRPGSQPVGKRRSTRDVVDHQSLLALFRGLGSSPAQSKQYTPDLLKVIDE